MTGNRCRHRHWEARNGGWLGRGYYYITYYIFAWIHVTGKIINGSNTVVGCNSTVIGTTGLIMTGIMFLILTVG
jgi:hypothetical protein